MRVFIIGIDGATFDIIRPMADRGWLPNIAKLMHDGVSGDLQSTIHPITPQAWSTFLTGKNAGRHGIFDFIARREGSYDITYINASSRAGESLFQHLSRKGLRVGAIAIPFTFPPEPVNGFMLSGFDAPAEDERAVYPRELHEEIRRRFGAYYIHLASPVGRSDDPEKFWRDIQTEDENRTEISLYLAGREPLDLFMTLYNNTDRVQHQYLTPDFLEALADRGSDKARRSLVARAYENVDNQVARILELTTQDDVVILVSDHGSGPIRRVFFLNRWLADNGYLAYHGSGRADTLERARRMTKRLLPRWAKGLIKGSLPGLRDKVESYRAFAGIDWGGTRAYGFGMYGNIYLNLQGREPQGTVPPEDFDATCTEIADRLMELRDPESGELLVQQVCRREDLYDGPCSSRAPDLVIRWRDYSCYTSVGSGPEEGGWFGGFGKIDSSDFDHVGTHRLNGIFIAAGKAVRSGTELRDAHIADVAPTVIFALGQPIPEDMDGRVLRTIFTPEFLAGRDVRYAQAGRDSGGRRVAYSAEEARAVEERLKGLGYL